MIEKVALASHEVAKSDIEEAKAAGLTDEAIYDAITVCALFKFFNTWVDAAGVDKMTPESYTASGRRLAERGYIPSE